MFEHGHIFDTANLARFGDTIESVLETRLKGYSERRPPDLYLSNVGQPLRKLWFQIKSGLLPEKMLSSTKFKFLYGDLIEAVTIALAIEAGHDVTDLQKSVEVGGVRGRIDCIIDGCLIDVKSAASRSFLKFKEGTLFQDDPFGYVAQLKGYKIALGNIPAGWLAIDKEKGTLALLNLPEDYQYDLQHRIVQAREVLAKDTPPEQLCYEPEPDGKSGNIKIAMPCSYCDFKYHCFKGLRGFAYSNGPRYLTHVERVPDVFEITPKKI